MMEFEADSDKEEYKVEEIWDSAVYAKESAAGHLPGFYYLISWKGYSEEENTSEYVSAVQHLQKLIRIFHKDNSNKPTATFPPADTAPPIARPFRAPLAIIAKWKRGRQVTSTQNKKAKT